MGTYDLLREMNDAQRQMQFLHEQLLARDWMDMLREEGDEYLEAVLYMQSVGRALRFPQLAIRSRKKVETDLDTLLCIVRKGRRLHFSKRWMTARVEGQYRHFIKRTTSWATAIWPRFRTSTKASVSMFVRAMSSSTSVPPTACSPLVQSTRPPNSSYSKTTPFGCPRSKGLCPLREENQPHPQDSRGPGRLHLRPVGNRVAK